jgi:palmitoyl transferase
MRIRRWTLRLAAAAILGPLAASSALAACDDMWDWVNMACRHVVDTYSNGHNEILVSGYAWHIPSTWTAEARANENELAWGAGWSRTLERDDNVTENVFFLVFNDSHSQPEFQVGYGWNYFWGERDSIQPGLGYTVMIVQRPDIANGIPFPAILPLFSLRYQKATLISTFIPTLNGGVNHGSILYIFGSIGID